MRELAPPPDPGGVVDAARSVELIVGRRRDLPDRDCRLTHRSTQRVAGSGDGHLAEAHAGVVRGDPGVGEHPEPGGLTVREVVSLIQRLDAPLVAADVVECNPEVDPSGITSYVAAKLVKEIAAAMHRVAR